MSIILAVFKAIGVIFSLIFERKQEIKQKKKEALNEITEGIKKRDGGRITAGFDRINRM